MKTLYLNINGENIQNTDDIIVVGRPEDAIINKFFFELGKEILKGVVVPGVTSIRKKDLVTDFKGHDEKSFNSIMEQWETLKLDLLSDNQSGTRPINLPEEYITWLQNSSQLAYAEIAKSLYSRGGKVEVSLEKIYKNAIGIIVNNIEPEECKDCSQFVVNDDAVTDDSAITALIQERMPQIAFVPFEDFGKCPKCGKKPCECKPESPVCPKCVKNPCECSNDFWEGCLFAVEQSEGNGNAFFRLLNEAGNDVEKEQFYVYGSDEAFIKSKYYRGTISSIEEMRYPENPLFKWLYEPLFGICKSDNSIRLMTKNGSRIVCKNNKNGTRKSSFDNIFPISFPLFEIGIKMYFYDGKQIVKDSVKIDRIMRLIGRKSVTDDEFNEIDYATQARYGKMLLWPGNKQKGFDLQYEDVEGGLHNVSHFDVSSMQARMFTIDVIHVFWSDRHNEGSLLINVDGNELLPSNTYCNYTKLSENYFKAQNIRSGKWGVFDMKGKTVIPPKYNRIAIIDY